MKHIIIYIFAATSLMVGVSLPAQTTVKMSAVKGNNYGVAYSLPKTMLEITAVVRKTVHKAGEYHLYAERYLGIKNPIKENETFYELGKMTVTSKGVPDKSNSYLVEFRSNTVSPFVTLTKDGLICAINSDAVFDAQPTQPEVAADTAKAELPNPRSFLSEEILSAGSAPKRAELIAKQIYRLRESKNSILTGDADNRPPDGNAYKLVLDQISQQEKALTEMFTGHVESETSTVRFTIMPTEKNIEKQVLFRFSKYLGVVAPDDLSGNPVYLTLENKTPVEQPVLTPKEEKAMQEKFSRGIIYNIPGKADLKILYGGNTLLQGELDVVQFGKQDVLAEKMFDDNKQPIKVIFYPELGAIKQIIQ